MPSQSMPNQLPWSYADLGPALSAFRPPAGAFDPNAAWDHRYAVWIVLPQSNAGATRRMGWLRIQRQPTDAATCRLNVDLAAEQGDRTVYRGTWRITGATDHLATPRQWDMQAQILDPQGQPIADTQIVETGEVSNGVIHRRGATERSIPAPAAWTGNWSLFDAVQRLPNSAEPLTFTMLEELELVKPNQRLAYRDTLTLELGGRPLQLHCFEQIGEGILPYHYWLDDQRRLLIAIGGLRAFIFDASAGKEGAA